MSFDITILSEAEFDIEDIELYYNNISKKLTDRFFRELYKVIDHIQLEPRLYQVRYRNIHIAPLDRFPYGVHYMVMQNEIIILRVLHTSRYFK